MGIDRTAKAVRKGLQGLTKEDIRCTMLRRLNSQKEEDRTRKSKILQDKLLRTYAFKKAKNVVCYLSFGGEVDTKDMITQAHKLGKKVGVPFCKTYRMMRACLFSPGMRLVRGIYGTKEPAIKKFMRLRDIDLVIVPGMAFDTKGNRVGRGKGCYDYFLRKLPKATATIGLAYDFQILPRVPATPNDSRVDRVIFA